MVINQCGSLEAETSKTEAKAMTVVRGPIRNPDAAATCMLCSRAGCNSLTCQQYRMVERKPEENGRREEHKRNGNGDGDGDGGERQNGGNGGRQR